jgi:hypothetical protein
MRILKRQLSNVVWKRMIAEMQRQEPHAVDVAQAA